MRHRRVKKKSRYFKVLVTMHSFCSNPPKKLVLASGSAYRKALLKRLKLPFSVAVPNVDETPMAIEQPVALARRLSEIKARAVVEATDVDTLYIGSDQVAFCKDRLLGKPGSHNNAIEQLMFCAGERVTFYTGLALWRPQLTVSSCDVVETQVTLRALDRKAVDRYVKLEEPLDCAGSFRWEALGISLFDELSGSDPTALEGLPLITLCHRLREHGYDLP